MNANQFISLLGLTSDDDKVRAFLATCGITKQPKLKRGDETTILGNTKLGIEVTFEDERYLDVKSQEYEEGALVVSNIRMYGGGHSSMKRFHGELPLGLTFDLEWETVQTKLARKPAWNNEELTRARWDFETYCLFVVFDEQHKTIKTVSVQLPVA